MQAADPEGLYGALGVETDAPPEKIKRAYRRKAREQHPDHGGDPEQFKALAIAYEVLGDQQRRQQYDQTGSSAQPRGHSAIESKVAELARAAFSEDRRNPLKWMTDQVENVRASLQEVRDKKRREAERYEKKLAKLLQANKKPKRSEALAMLQACLEVFKLEAEQAVARCEEEIKLATEVLDYLHGLRYPDDESVKTDRRAGSVMFSSGSSPFSF